MTPTTRFQEHGPLLARVDDLGVLAFDGLDAAAFLHGQLSTDVEGMPEGAAAWTSYNSPKGRMLATLLLWHRAPGEFRAFVAADLAAALRKRLAMFVLRAKVTVTDRSADGALFGVMGRNARDAVLAAFGLAPLPGHGATAGDVDVVATPDGRYLVRASSTAPLSLPEAPAGYWNWLAIRAAVPWITLATQDRFIAQTANLDLIDGINFRKGCYPGQEIVARMQYLGRLKERLYAFHVDDGPPAPATPIFEAGSAGSPAGTVLNAAPAPGGGSDLLAVTAIAAVAAGDLRLGAPDGPRLATLDLPYVVPPPSAPNRVKL